MPTPLRLLPALLLPLLAACGGGDRDWSGPDEAFRAAEQARAEADADTATAAYRFVADDQAAALELRYQALLGLAEVQLSQGRKDEARATCDRLLREHDARLDARGLVQLADAWILHARDAEEAARFVQLGRERFPDQAAIFEKARKAIDALETQGAGADLGSLGYVGD